MKKWMVIVVGVLVALVALGAVKDFAIKMAVESGTQLVTGLKLQIGTFRVGIFNTLVDIRKLRLLNPAGFKDKTMLDMPEIYVSYDLPAIFAGKVHLKEVRINMKEFVVVKNEKGQLNLNSLKVVQAQKAGVKPSAQAGGKAPEIQIDKLHLTIGKVYYKDYSNPGAPRVMEYNVNINEEYTNITDPYSLVSLIVVKALANTSVSRLTNFDIKGLSGSVSDALGSAQKVTAQAADTAMETAKTATETARKASETIKDTTSAVGDTFKNVFGSSK